MDRNERLNNVLSKVHKLKMTQFRYLASMQTYTDLDETDKGIDVISIRKMSVDRSLQDTGHVAKINSQNTEERCTICYEFYYANDIIRELKCKHRFHKRCIDACFYPKYHNDDELLCPLCRQDILPNTI